MMMQHPDRGADVGSCREVVTVDRETTGEDFTQENAGYTRVDTEGFIDASTEVTAAS